MQAGPVPSQDAPEHYAKAVYIHSRGHRVPWMWAVRPITMPVPHQLRRHVLQGASLQPPAQISAFTLCA